MLQDSTQALTLLRVADRGTGQLPGSALRRCKPWTLPLSRRCGAASENTAIKYRVRVLRLTTLPQSTACKHHATYGAQQVRRIRAQGECSSNQQRCCLLLLLSIKTKHSR